MGLFKALSGGVGLFGAILSCGAFWLLGAGAWAAIHYEGMNPTPSYTLNVKAPVLGFTIFRHTFAGPTTWAERDARDKAGLAQCSANVSTLSAALDRQNAATAAISAAGAQARARAETAIRASRAATAAASENEARILAAIKPGDTECERYREVDSAFVGVLR